MKHLLTLILTALTLLGNTSCQYLINKASYTDPSTISGKQGDVLVVINKEYWDSPLGQMIRDSLKLPDPMLPQSEARFKVSNVSSK